MKRLRSSDDLDSCNDDGDGGGGGGGCGGGGGGGGGGSGSSSYHRSFSGNNFSRMDRDAGGFSRAFSRRRSNRDFVENHHPSRYHRSSRRDFPKGFRSEREVSVSSSWRRFGGGDFGVEDRRLRESERESRSLRSPSWSRDDQSKSKQLDTRRSRSRPLASPTWSKDSGSEQSRSVGNGAKRKEEEVVVKSSSEMEEGELEPEVKDDDNEDNNTKQPSSATDVDKNVRVDSVETEKNSDFDVETESNREVSHVGDGDKISVEEGGNVPEHASESMHVSENDTSTALASEQELSPTTGTASVDEIRDMVEDKVEEYKENHEVKLEESHYPDVPEQFQVEELKGVKGNDGDANKADVESRMECVEENALGNGKNVEYVSIVSDSSVDKCKDKSESSDVPVTRLLGNSLFPERKSEDVTEKDKDEKDDNFEGPSIRGFELFSTSPVRRTNKTEQSGYNKPKDEKLLLEPLDLSLSLPDVLMPIGGQDANQPLGSPVRSGSVRSLTDTFCTNSDGFTMSMSFSGSRSFNHNPSCSLNHNVGDNEQSVHSRPIFQGIDWQALSHNDSKYNENTVYQKLMENGNGSFQPQAMKGVVISGQADEEHLRLADGSSKAATRLEKQLSFQKSIDASRSACPRTNSLENGSSLNVEKKKAKDFFSGMTGLEEAGGHEFVETVISYILSDSMQVMTKRFHEMPARYINSLMENIRQMMLNVDKNVHLGAFQDALQNRTDITLEMLTKSHRAQLEILVALKTGRSDFLQLDKSVSSSHLAEIYMNTRCKNLSCRALVPVDECDCRVCSRKDGFCSACMCLVCSNFDMASNTCSWVGCDVCLHWCHTDCAIRESYIRNGINASGAAPGMTEMQFHCVACNHPSEMFGFVKEVFLNFAKEWKLERFCKELEYVHKIFSSSKDSRGKHLRQAADAMLARLKSKSIDLAEACSRMLSFLSDCDSSTPGEACAPVRYEQPNHGHERGSHSQDTAWLRSVSSDKPHHQLKRSASFVDSFQRERPAEICGVELGGLKRGSPKEPRFEELESIVKMKQAEAEMFQGRADDARREAEGLKRIAIAKKETIEEEYKRRIGSLSLEEAEERRRKKHEELEALERGRREFYEMKMRMEEEMRGLLTKMEVTKQSLAL